MCRSCWKRWKNNGIVRKPRRFGFGYPFCKRVRPFRAERFSLNLSGECADAARAHKRVDTYGFHPLVNHPFPLEGLAQIADM